MRLADVEQGLEELFPLHLAASWDPVGRQLGRDDQPIKRMMLTIDATEAVVEEAIAGQIDLLLAYHPVLFHPPKRWDGDDPDVRPLTRAAAHDLAIWSPHTAFDAIQGGVTDWLVKPYGQGRPLQSSNKIGANRKITVFIPFKDHEHVREAMANAGAGSIGAYRECSFSTRGTGTFRGLPGTSPAIGSPERLESVEEQRLEMVCAEPQLPLVLAALRRTHPYEEPAIDITTLLPEPQPNTGAGRVVSLAKATSLNQLAEVARTHLGLTGVEVADAAGASQKHKILAACPGSGADLIPQAAAAGATVFLTGEMKHHEQLHALRNGVSLILAGHTNTERGALKPWTKVLQKSFPTINIKRSRRDRHPLRRI